MLSNLDYSSQNSVKTVKKIFTVAFMCKGYLFSKQKKSYANSVINDNCTKHFDEGVEMKKAYIHNLKVVSAILLAASLTASLIPLTAHASTSDSNEYASAVSNLQKSHGYVYSYDELDSQITQVAQQTSKTKLAVVQETLAESQKYETGYDAAPKTRASNSSKHNPLADAKNPGDVFVSEGNNTIGWNHGHTGIFVSKTAIVEAVGPDKNARQVSRKSSLACGRSFLQSVTTSQTKRNKAVARARTYIGRGYNAVIIGTNRNDWGGLNCSQLVWASYMYGAAVDLAPKDNFVYPYSTRDSSLTRTYRTINV